MPLPTQNALIHVIMLWITILSVVQILVIILFFTVGHQNSSAVSERQTQIKPSNAPPSTTPRSQTDGAKMITFESTNSDTKIIWASTISNQDLILEKKGESMLTIMKDGYFLILLQVTLSYDNALGGSQYTVSLMRADKVILQGIINNNTCSTGLLGKVVMLPAGHTLEVTFNSTITDVTVNQKLTHLDIVYMPMKP